MKNFIYSIILAGTAIFSLVIVASVGCGSPDQLGKGGGAGGTAGVVTLKLDGSTSSNGGGSGNGGGGGGVAPTGDANCGSQTNNTSHEPADVLLVLDRSGSMNESIAESCYCDPALASGGGGGIKACADTTNCTPRWKSLTAGLNTTLSSTPDIRWGLKLYSSPGGSSCTVSNGVEVQIGANSASTIQSQIAGVTPASNTPTAAAVTTATAYLKTVSDNSNKVILLATDGEPNCAAGGNSSTTDRQGTINAITAAKNAGFLVYVIGIGPEVGNLNDFASAGGTGTYFPATSSADLASALASISKAVATCTFTLSATPPDVTNVAVYLDKNLVTQDAANGWSFGANSKIIVLNGDTCDKVTSGQATTVQVLFGCAGGPPPPLIIP